MRCMDRLSPTETLVPIRVKGELIGALAFGPKIEMSAYTATDRACVRGVVEPRSPVLGRDQLVTELATDIERMQQVELQLKTAREVQSRLVTCSLPPIEGLDYYGECRRGDEVGGDFLNFLGALDPALIVCAGDVSKKGIPAAIIVAALQATVRALSWTTRGPLYSSIEQLNQLVCEIAPDGFYASMFLGQIDPLRRRLQYVNAGTSAAMIVRHKANRVIGLETTGPVLGLSDRTSFHQRGVQFEPGDTFVALTEGIVDAIDVEGHGSHEQMVLNAIRDHRDASSADLACELLDTADRFTKPSPSRDDRTVVVIRFPGPPMTIMVERAPAKCELSESLCANAV